VANAFEFLDPLIALETKIADLEQMSQSTGVNMTTEIQSLREKLMQMSRSTFTQLTPWQRVQLSRHLLRPETSDYIDHMIQDFVPLAGDRCFGDDEAIVAGIGRLGGQPLMVIGQQKGKDVHERRRCNFGMPHPEGYRKAIHKMRLAEKFSIPVLCLVNTPGAFPGIEAEERGQSIAIAENIRAMSLLRTPVVVVVIGEGGSGGALGIGVGDRMLMLENSYFSVITPEGCAAILWKDAAKKDLAAERMGLTGEALKKLGIVDEVIEEPAGGAHRQPLEMARALQEVLIRHFTELRAMPIAALLDARYAKYRAIGAVLEAHLDATRV
jgi:acetyl-CoA carboxylase carboxyl transferase subunit alpha